MQSSFVGREFSSQQGENLQEYAAIAKIFNEAVAEIIPPKPYLIAVSKSIT